MTPTHVTFLTIDQKDEKTKGSYIVISTALTILAMFFFINTKCLTFELGVGTKSREFVTMNCPLLCNSNSDIHRFELRLALLGLT